MSPLVALLLFGFMFVIALSLTLWAALTLNDGARGEEDEAPSVSYVPLGSAPPVWRREEQRRGEYRRDETVREVPVREGRGRGEQRPLGAREGVSLASSLRVVERGVDRGGGRGVDVGSGRVVERRVDRGAERVVDSGVERPVDRGARRGSERRSVVSHNVPPAVPPAPRQGKPGNQGASQPANHGAARSNDEVRGARATVTQRPNNDDAFERFLENDRDERRR